MSRSHDGKARGWIQGFFHLRRPRPSSLLRYPIVSPVVRNSWFRQTVWQATPPIHFFGKVYLSYREPPRISSARQQSTVQVVALYQEKSDVLDPPSSGPNGHGLACHSPREQLPVPCRL